jgi:predicted RNA-binding Zn ribbon-like protein
MAWAFDRTSDDLALDFANTVSERASPAPIERLPAYRDLVEFGRQTGILPPDRARALDRAPASQGREVHARAIALRDALYDAFAAIARGEAIDAEDLEAINVEVARVRIGHDLAPAYESDPRGLAEPLGPIVLRAFDLLTTSQRDRVRICAADTCAFLFLDRSKNGSRRWCDMQQCGNREKARRHYARATVGSRPA